MLRMCWAWVWVVAAAGCGGHYILAVPDQIAPSGGQAVAVVRLQRNDFFVLSLAEKDALIRFRAADGVGRAAHTDKLGYAGAAVAVPAVVGRYVMVVEHTDHEGDEIRAEAPLYVWDAGRAVVAVDLDCLPHSRSSEAKDARRALKRLAAGANLLYLTRRPVRRHAEAHAFLDKLNYPDGPVLLWQRERWHIVRTGRFRIPRIVIETRMVSRLAELRKTFPGLKAGVCTGQPAARGLSDAGLKCVVVGGAKLDSPNVTRRKSWALLADKGT